MVYYLSVPIKTSEKENKMKKYFDTNKMGDVKLMSEAERFIFATYIENDIDRACSRIHLLEGYLVALKNVERIMQLINQEDAKEHIMKEFALTRKQVTSILTGLRLKDLRESKVACMEEELKELKLIKDKLEDALEKIKM